MPEPERGKPGRLRQRLLAPTGQINLGLAPVESLAESLGTRIRREKFHTVDEVTLKISGPLINLLHIRNLLTRLAPEKSIDINISSDIRRPRSPRYTLVFDLNKQDAATEEGRSLLDIAWRMKGAERCDTTLTMKWSAGAELEDVVKIIRSLGEGASEPLLASLEAKVSRRL